MKWIGQNIYDQISRFRNDVYLESISTGTIISGGHLGLDSNDKIVKAVDGGGDLTSIVAGTGLGGTSLTGPIPTLNVDASLTHVTGVGTITTGVWEGTDVGVAHGGTGASTLTDNAVLLGNGTGVVEASSHLNYFTPASNQDYFRIGDGSTTISGIISDNAAPLVISVEGNTGTNAAGGDLTLIAGSSTGSGAGGDFIFRSSAAGGSGTTARVTTEIAALDNVGNLQIDGGLTTGSTAAITNAGLLSVAAQTNVTSLGTLTALDVDNININGSTITASADLALVATGNDITIDTDTVTIESATENAPILELKTTHTTVNRESELKFTKDAADTEDNESLGMITFNGEDEGNNETRFGFIRGKIEESDEGAEGGRIDFAVLSHDGEMQKGLEIVDGNAEDEIDVTIGNGTSSVTTLAGTLTMGSTAALTNDGLVAVGAQTGITACANLVTVGTIGTGAWQGTAIAHAYIGDDAIDGDNIADDAVDSEHYADGSIDTAHIADDQVTFAKASGVTPNVFGNIIKLLPSDFVTNDDAGVGKFGIGYVDHAGGTYGMKPTNASTELYAFVSIPEGMAATHVDIFDKNDKGIIVYEAQINATTLTSKGTGNCNTTIDITDVNSSATNFLAIQVTTDSTGDRIFGGQVTIAAQ